MPSWAGAVPGPRAHECPVPRKTAAATLGGALCPPLGRWVGSSVCAPRCHTAGRCPGSRLAWLWPLARQSFARGHLSHLSRRTGDTLPGSEALSVGGGGRHSLGAAGWGQTMVWAWSSAVGTRAARAGGRRGRAHGSAPSPLLCVLAGLPGHGRGQGHRRGARTPRGCGAHGESPPHPDSPADSGGRWQMCTNTLGDTRSACLERRELGLSPARPTAGGGCPGASPAWARFSLPLGFSFPS